MTVTLKYILSILSLFLYTSSNAQLEVAHISSKGFSATGFGGFLNFAIPVSEASSVTAEAGGYIFKQNDETMLLVPLLLGYRYSLNGSSTGLYLEPTAGYSIGATDIQKYNEIGSPIPDGSGGWLEQKVKGITAGMGVGYIFSERFPINVGLRYQHVFVSNDPTLNMFSLRLSHTLSFGRRE